MTPRSTSAILLLRSQLGHLTHLEHPSMPKPTTLSEVRSGTILVGRSGARYKVRSRGHRLYIQMAGAQQWLDELCRDGDYFINFHRAPRGFACLSPAERTAMATLGGASVPASSRSFSQDNTLAKTAGAKGGKTPRGVRA